MREQHTGHERGPVERVVPDSQGLALGAEENLLVRHQARGPHRMHVQPVDHGAARSVERLRRGIGHGSEAGVRARAAR